MAFNLYCWITYTFNMLYNDDIIERKYNIFSMDIHFNNYSIDRIFRSTFCIIMELCKKLLN